MKTIYLSGKITGLEKSVYEKNFQQAELFYRACGYEVVNPCHISAEVLKNKPNASYEDFMKADLKALRVVPISQCLKVGKHLAGRKENWQKPNAWA